jgi:hypothetical protein
MALPLLTNAPGARHLQEGWCKQFMVDARGAYCTRRNATRQCVCVRCSALWWERGGTTLFSNKQYMSSISLRNKVEDKVVLKETSCWKQAWAVPTRPDAHICYVLCPQLSINPKHWTSSKQLWYSQACIEVSEPRCCIKAWIQFQSQISFRTAHSCRFFVLQNPIQLW